jgi:transcriptional regulator with XRE-family HTH domain
MDDRIRELRRAGWSERRIAAALGVTRHRVRTALAGFRPPTPIRGATWVEEVELHIDRARLRKDDPEQLDLGDLALDVAEWLDAHDDDESWIADQLANSLRLVIKGVAEGSDPLVRIHARRTFGLRDLAVPAWLKGGA